MASGLLPKSPVSSSLCDEVPHIFIPKSHLEPREFLISSAKRLLQQYRHKADIPTNFIADQQHWNENDPLQTERRDLLLLLAVAEKCYNRLHNCNRWMCDAVVLHLF